MPRIHPADEQATLDLATTAQCGKRNRAVDLCFLLIISLFLLGFGVAIFLLPQENFSEQENRALQTMPVLSLDALTDNQFSADIADFYADQFPARTAFVGLKTLTEVSALRMENNGVLIGKNGYLIKRLEYGEDGYGNIRENLHAVSDFTRSMTDRNIPVTLAIAPRGIDVLTAYLPDYYSPIRADAAWEVTRQIAAETGLTPVLFNTELQGSASVGTEVWFHTDHHWTPRGAYLAYMLLADELGYLPGSPSALTEETINAPFYGTT